MKKEDLKDLPNYMTMGNLVCGAAGMERVWAGDMITALILMVVALVLDFFDGFLARKLGVDGEMGKQLDSLADLVTFGVLPGLILHHYMMTYGYCSPDGFCSSRYAWVAIPVGAAWRLARFNISAPSVSGFTGVPTPITGIALASIILSLEEINGIDRGWLADLYSNFYFLAMAPVIAAFFMVSDLPMMAFKKISGNVLWLGMMLGAWIAIALIFQRDSGPLIWISYVFISLLANFAKPKINHG